MEKARYNTELYSNLKGPLNNVKPSNFWGSHQKESALIVLISLFPLLEFLDVVEDFRGSVYYLLVHTHSDETSDQTSQKGSAAESHGHWSCSECADHFIDEPAEPYEYHRDGNLYPVLIMLPDASELLRYFHKVAVG